MRWVGHVARMGEERGVYRVLVGKPEGRRSLGRRRRRWVDNIMMDLQEVGCGYMDWIELAQDRDRWRTLVSAVMNLRVRGISWLAANQLASQEGLCTMEWVSKFEKVYMDRVSSVGIATRCWMDGLILLKQLKVFHHAFLEETSRCHDISISNYNWSNSLRKACWSFSHKT